MGMDVPGVVSLLRARGNQGLGRPVTDASLRVTHLVPALFDEKIGIVGGGERYALELARCMAERTPTRLVTFGPEDCSRIEGNLRIDVIGGAWQIGGQPSNPFSFRLIRKLRHSDVIHC